MYKAIILTISLLGLLCAQEFEYVGTKKCKTCHKKEKTGNQFGIWNQSKHAQSFETLKSDLAAELIKNAGIDGNAWESEACVKCHTTGYGHGGYEIKDESFWGQVTDKGKPTKEVKRMAGLESVGCETCHGPGSKYKSKKKMQAIYDGTLEKSIAGLIIPSEETCIKCHNDESPTYKSFNYKEKLEKIAHSYPADMQK